MSSATDQGRSAMPMAIAGDWLRGEPGEWELLSGSDEGVEANAGVGTPLIMDEDDEDDEDVEDEEEEDEDDAI